MKWGHTGNRFGRLLRHQRGGVLLEALIAVGLLATVLSFAVQGLATGSRATGTVRDLTTALNLARSQMEHTLNAVYCAAPCSYPVAAVPAGYAVTVEALPFPGADADLEYVLVTVRKDGESLAQIRRIKVDR